MLFFQLVFSYSVVVFLQGLGKIMGAVTLCNKIEVTLFIRLRCSEDGISPGKADR
jgi:hypothetical protein